MAAFLAVQAQPASLAHRLHIPAVHVAIGAVVPAHVQVLHDLLPQVSKIASISPWLNFAFTGTKHAFWAQWLARATQSESDTQACHWANFPVMVV